MFGLMGFLWCISYGCIFYCQQGGKLQSQPMPLQQCVDVKITLFTIFSPPNAPLKDNGMADQVRALLMGPLDQASSA